DFLRLLELGLRIDGDALPRQHPRAELADDLVVDANPALGDPFVGLAARRDPELAHALGQAQAAGDSGVRVRWGWRLASFDFGSRRAMRARMRARGRRGRRRAAAGECRRRLVAEALAQLFLVARFAFGSLGLRLGQRRALARGRARAAQRRSRLARLLARGRLLELERGHARVSVQRPRQNSASSSRTLSWRPVGRPWLQWSARS